MTKAVLIRSCHECPNYSHGGAFAAKRTNKCVKTRKELTNPQAIPQWCPLEDVTARGDNYTLDLGE